MPRQMGRPRAAALSGWGTALRTGGDAWAFYAVAYLVGGLHLAEVHLADAAAGDWVRGVTGSAFDAFAQAERPLMVALDVWRPDALVAAVTVFYLLGFVGLLAVTPPLIASTGDGPLLRRTLLAYPVTWLLAVPFYLFAPSRNPYTALGLASPFPTVHPDLEGLYYSLTTRDNTFPSLHVAFTALLVVRVLQSRLDLLKPAYVVHGLLLCASVVFLRVHYVADVLGGLVAAYVALRLADALVDGRLARVGGALDRVSRRGAAWRARRLVRLEPGARVR